MNTEDLFRTHLNTVTRDQKTWLTLFHSDAVIEFPYAPNIGFPGKISGIQNIKEYIESLPSGFEDFTFSHLKIYKHQDPNTLTAEFQGYIPASQDKPEYRQSYVCVFTALDGKIKNYREYWDPNNVTKFMGEKV